MIIMYAKAKTMLPGLECGNLLFSITFQHLGLLPWLCRPEKFKF